MHIARAGPRRWSRARRCAAKVHALAECDVYGTVTIEGNNTIPVRDRVNGTERLSAQNLPCSEVTRFDDANANHAVEDTEVTGPVDWGDADKIK